MLFFCYFLLGNTFLVKRSYLSHSQVVPDAENFGCCKRAESLESLFEYVSKYFHFVLWVTPKKKHRWRYFMAWQSNAIHVMGFWVIPSDLCKHADMSWITWLKLLDQLASQETYIVSTLNVSKEVAKVVAWVDVTHHRNHEKPTETNSHKLIKVDQKFLLLLGPRFQTASNALKCQMSETQLESENSQSLKILKHPGHFEAETLLSSREWALNMVWITVSLIPLIV